MIQQETEAMHQEQIREMDARRKGPSAMSTNYLEEKNKYIGQEGSKLNIKNGDITHNKDGKGVPRARAHEFTPDDGKWLLD